MSRRLSKRPPARLSATSSRYIVPLDERYEALLANARSDSLPVDTDWEDIFSIPYTSGSTGRPKGVMLSHRCRVLSSYAMASEHGCYGPDDRAVATTPMFHGSGFLMTLAPVFFGGFVELLPSFNIEALMRKIEDVSATSVYMVPTHFSSLFAMGDGRHAFNHSSLKCVIVGTAPLSQAMKVRIVEYIGEGQAVRTVRIDRGFDRDGACGPKDQLRKQQCVGLPLAATQIRILDAARQRAAPGPGRRALQHVELYVFRLPQHARTRWPRPCAANGSRRAISAVSTTRATSIWSIARTT